MRTTLELPDPLFARLRARAASERVTLKQLLCSYVDWTGRRPWRSTSSATPPCSSSSTQSTSANLPDLNVWLALAWPAHSHHQQAVHYWEHQAADQVLFCTVTALGLIRLVFQPKLMGTTVRNAAEAPPCTKPCASNLACGWPCRSTTAPMPIWRP